MLPSALKAQISTNIYHTDTEFVLPEKASNFAFDKFTVAKSEFVKLFLWFFSVKKWFHLILIIFYTCKCIFGVGCAAQLCGRVLWVGGWDTGPGRKIWQKVSSVNSFQWKNNLNYFWSNTFSKVQNLTNLHTGITKGGCITVLLTSCLTGLD